MTLKKFKHTKTFISQADNYAGNFGEVLRSSAIFWIKNNENIKTTISFSNYWKFKNFLDVRVLLNVRSLEGKLLERIPINFEKSEICNYEPNQNFEGSVEVEVFSIKNMRIPYAAIMAIYECSESISMVHSYSRIYSLHEIEENRTITVGEESCWTLRDNADTTSFCVIHNGAYEQEGQIVTLAIRNHLGKEKTIDYKLKKLNPYETLIIEPKKQFPEIVNWLNGNIGNGRLSFKLNGSFTRMLCGIKKEDNSQLQVTHSNFDYSKHDTDKIKDGIVEAFMITPNTKNLKQEIVVYPDTNEGKYRLYYDNSKIDFKTGEIIRVQPKTNEGSSIRFERKDKILPTRIVTALRLNPGEDIICAECSLGIVHHSRPPKNFSWMLVSKKFNTNISWVDFENVYGGCPNEAEFVFKLYPTNTQLPIEKKFIKSELPNSQIIELKNIFTDLTWLGDSYSYLTVWCSYGGLMFFSSLKKNNSITIEHSF